ncbi:Trypsin, partial [Operophtera brumata]
VQESLKLFRVRLGSVDCKRGGILFPIQLVEIHPAFVRGRPSFDLALIRLAVPVKLTVTDSVHPIPLSKLDGTVVWRRALPAVAKERVNFTKMRVSIQELIPSIDCAQMVDKLDKGNLCLKPLNFWYKTRNFWSPLSPATGHKVVT